MMYKTLSCRPLAMRHVWRPWAAWRAAFKWLKLDTHVHVGVHAWKNIPIDFQLNSLTNKMLHVHTETYKKN